MVTPINLPLNVDIRTRGAINSLNRLLREITRVENRLNRRHRINVDTSGARRNVSDLTNVLGSLIGATGRTNRAFAILGGTIGGIAFGAVALAVGRQIDQFITLENRLRLVTDGMMNLLDVQGQLFDVARDTRSAFFPVSSIFTRTALSAERLGRSQQEILNFTRSLQQAAVVSGTSLREQNAAVIQLLQGIASDRLSGDELRAVLEQLPYASDIIARSLGTDRGGLRALARSGAVGAEEVLNAFRDSRQEIQDAFEQTRPTFEQSFSVINNEFGRLLGNLDAITGFSDVFTGFILQMADAAGVLNEFLEWFRSRGQVSDTTQEGINRAQARRESIAQFPTNLLFRDELIRRADVRRYIYEQLVPNFFAGDNRIFGRSRAISQYIQNYIDTIGIGPSNRQTVVFPPAGGFTGQIGDSLTIPLNEFIAANLGQDENVIIGGSRGAGPVPNFRRAANIDRGLGGVSEIQALYQSIRDRERRRNEEFAEARRIAYTNQFLNLDIAGRGRASPGGIIYNPNEVARALQENYDAYIESPEFQNRIIAQVNEATDLSDFVDISPGGFIYSPAETARRLQENYDAYFESQEFQNQVSAQVNESISAFTSPGGIVYDPVDAANRLQENYDAYFESRGFQNLVAAQINATGEQFRSPGGFVYDPVQVSNTLTENIQDAIDEYRDSQEFRNLIAAQINQSISTAPGSRSPGGIIYNPASVSIALQRNLEAGRIDRLTNQDAVNRRIAERNAITSQFLSPGGIRYADSRTTLQRNELEANQRRIDSVNRLSDIFSDNLSDAIGSLIDDSLTAEQALRRLGASILQSLGEIALQHATRGFANALFGAGGPAAGGAGFLSSFFAGPANATAGFNTFPTPAFVGANQGFQGIFRGRHGTDNNFIPFQQGGFFLSNGEDIRIRTPLQRSRDNDNRNSIPTIIIQNTSNARGSIGVLGTNRGRRIVRNEITESQRDLQRSSVL